MTHLRRYRLIVALLALVALLTFLFYRNDTSARKETVPVAAVKNPMIGIGALGRIEPRSRVLKISHNAGPEGARIETLNVEEGQDVTQDDVLAILSDFPRKQAEAAQAQASVRALEARYRVEELNKVYAEKNYNRGKKLMQEKDRKSVV